MTPTSEMIEAAAKSLSQSMISSGFNIDYRDFLYAAKSAITAALAAKDHALTEAVQETPDATNLVLIPRTQYEALIAAAKALQDFWGFTQGRGGEYHIVARQTMDALDALRAAGVEMGDHS